ncbi:hypothetical protein JRQ81_014197 [Phrynocephalus forsythii]|uniref:Uncharacterized protein n=1 Tax=Phrynocephalus forsythii TaxID=171643 RepID=A0A9Q0XWV5_9SAUR|nr:hypothetical protein JRQ81_014197 [Phrynocephalus forsythii]
MEILLMLGDASRLVNEGLVAFQDAIASPQFLRPALLSCRTKLTVKAFLPQMMKRGHGHIVTIAGSLGLLAAGCLEGYCASQFAVVGFHEALSHELKAKRVNSVKTTLVCPYFIDTGMFHGCGIRQELKSLLSPLKPDRFVKTAVQGILRNQHMICIPRVIYLAAVSKHLLPWDAQVLIQRFLGLDKCIPQKAICYHSAVRKC